MAWIAVFKTWIVSASSKGVGSFGGSKRGSSVSGDSIFFGFAEVLGFGFWAEILSRAISAVATVGCFFSLGIGHCPHTWETSAPREALAWGLWLLDRANRVSLERTLVLEALGPIQEVLDIGIIGLKGFLGCLRR